MNNKLKIWAYCVAWNEEKMIEYWIRHYSSFCERLIVYDNESTDSTRYICSAYPNVEVRTYSTDNQLNDFKHLEIKKAAISEARSKADFVIVTDADEFVFHEDIHRFLMNNQGIYSVFYPVGFEMVTNEFPRTEKIFDSVKRGVPSPWYSKPILIDPNSVFDLDWVEGCHELVMDSLISFGDVYHPVKKEEIPKERPYKGHMWPRYQKQFEILHRFKDEPLKLLHCKFMSPEYVMERYQMYRLRISKDQHENLAIHYTEDINKRFDELNSQSIQIIK